MSQRLFIDTNIMLDLLGEREPFYLATAQLATLADREEVTLVASPISFATVNYFLAKFTTPKIAIEKLRRFKILCEVCSLNEQTIEKGLNSSFKDFEDALQYYSAIDANCDIIITRNAKDFKKSQIPIMGASEFIESWKNK